MPRATRGGGRPAAVGASIPAPVEGWDASSALADMPPARAIVLENFFPEPGQVRLRRGFVPHATGLGGAVESLMSWNGPAGSRLFAAAGGAIHDVTAEGSAGAAVVDGLGSTRFQHVNFGAGGGNHLVICNGVDAVRTYNGSAWNTPAITGVAPADLVHVMAFKNRLFFLQKDSLSVWYLGTQAIAGAATRLDLSGLFRLGGSLQLLGSWTLDGGNGMDDLAVFITSEGEVAVFQGTDPASADSWALAGVYRIGAPIGRRALIKVGGDLGVISVDGFLPLSTLLKIERAQAASVSLSGRIRNAVAEATRQYRGHFGWQAIGYPRGGWALFNVPVSETSRAEQYVMNIATGAWCKFTGMNANCWELLGDRLYFGGNDGRVHRADEGLSDDGAARRGNIKTAFTYFGSRGRLKQFKMVRPLISADAAITPAVELNVNFEDRFPTAVPSAAGAAGPFWDITAWDSVGWGGAADVQQSWTAVRGAGSCAAVRLRVSSDAADVAVSAFDALFELGGLV